MTTKQSKSLLEEFDSFDVKLQNAIIRKYKQKFNAQPEGEQWLEYLKSILKIEAYWKAVGLKD